MQDVGEAWWARLGEYTARVTKYGHFCGGGSERNKSQLVAVHTRGAPPRKSAAGGKKRQRGWNISQRVRSWLSALAAMVTERTDIHPWDRSGTASWTGNGFVL